MKKRFSVVLLTILFSAMICIGARAQEGASLESAKLGASDALLQNLLLVCDKGTLRYSVSGGSEKGIASIELYSGEKLINYTGCGDAKQCRLAGVVAVATLPNPVITASVTASDKTDQKEKVRITFQGEETKVYMISSLPGLSGAEQIIAAKEPAQGLKTETEPAKPESGIDIAMKPKGPSIEVKVVTNGQNDFTMNVVTKDDVPIDFVEILENGVFMDVEICDKKPICSFSKSIKNRKPGTYKYVIKSMNIKEGISFYEETLSFTE